jgi:Zn finger protein HypA/HybF involved in hydrogenase expression
MDEQAIENTQKINAPTDKEYIDIIKSETETDKKFIEAEGQPAKIAYYCRNCKKSVTPKRIGKKLSFKCSECDNGPISFGTEDSIASYYKEK